MILKSKFRAQAILTFLLFVCDDGLFGAEIDSPKVHFYYDRPLYQTTYKVLKGSLSGLQKVFDDPNHHTITKDHNFTVLVDVSSPIYNAEKQWYEMSAVFCFGDSKDCSNKNQHFLSPYLVRPQSFETPVPFIIPFSKLSNKTLPDGKTVYEAGTVHDQFKTFEVNGATYDTSTGLLVRFSAKSSVQAGKISDIHFTRETGRDLKPQPLIQCHYVEWSSDGCVPGLNQMMFGYDIKVMEPSDRPWLKPPEFPERKDERYQQTLNIPDIGKKNYLVFKDMTLKGISTIAKPFSILFKSVEQRVKTALKSVGVTYIKGAFLGSGKYESYSKDYSKDYSKQSYSTAISGIEYHFFRTKMSSSFFAEETNWDDAFKVELEYILDQKKKENAMDFFREYGTHYVVKAVLGGRQETIFTVDYCEINKEEEKAKTFKSTLKMPYLITSSSVSIESYYKSMVSHSTSKMFISGPTTTCIGGNSFASDICTNITLWRQTVLINPWPIRMTLRPFYNLVRDYEKRDWMKKMYELYLKVDIDEVKINHTIRLKVKCESVPNHDNKLTNGSFIALWTILSLLAVAIL